MHGETLKFRKKVACIFGTFAYFHVPPLNASRNNIDTEF